MQKWIYLKRYKYKFKEKKFITIIIKFDLFNNFYWLKVLGGFRFLLTYNIFTVSRLKYSMQCTYKCINRTKKEKKKNHKQNIFSVLPSFFFFYFLKLGSSSILYNMYNTYTLVTYIFIYKSGTMSLFCILNITSG